MRERERESCLRTSLAPHKSLGDILLGGLVVGSFDGLLVNRNLFLAGARDGFEGRNALGALDSAEVGLADTALEGLPIGDSDEGEAEALDGTDVGCASVGISVGTLDGTDVGTLDGTDVGKLDGTDVGCASVGISVGTLDGTDVG